MFETTEDTLLTLFLMAFQLLCVIYQLIQELRFKNISQEKATLFKELEYIQKKIK